MRVVVGVSGGVDSSVACYLLKQQGYDVEAVIFKQVNANKCDLDTKCCSASAVEEAEIVCRQLKIPLHIKDMRDIFNKAVIQPTIAAYAKGETPSPCTTCNSKVRSVALNYVRKVLECDFFATGHYFKVKGGQVFRPKDTFKDQSYMVSLVNKDYFNYWLTPLADMVKPDVRHTANQIKLITANNPDSQDLCFNHLLPEFDRNVVFNGGTIGSYRGRPTVGQRKGFRGLNVLSISDTEITVCEKSIAKTEVVINGLNLLVETLPERLDIQLRSLNETVSGTVRGSNLILDNPNILTPGQVAAFYKEGQLLGGAIVSSS